MKLYAVFLIISVMLGALGCWFFLVKGIQKKQSYPGKTMLVLLGKPGSGKSSLVEQCQNIFGFNVVSLDKVYHEKNVDTHLILDDCPNTIVQAEGLLDLAKRQYPEHNLRIVLLDISDQEVTSRLLDRLVCENKACQSIYSRKLVNLMCSVCGSQLNRCTHDTHKAIENRLKNYHDVHHKLISFFNQAGHSVEVIPISGLTSFQVFNELKRNFEEK